MTAAAEVEHNWAQGRDDGATPDAERLDRARILARRNQHPQMVHAHPPCADCGLACLGILPGPPEPTRAVRAIAAAIAVIGPPKEAPAP